MQRVDSPRLVPGMCLFTKSNQGPLIDLGRDFDDDHVGRMYVQERYARELGHFAGLPSVDEYEEALGRVAALTAELAAASGKVAELEEFARAAEYTVESMGDRIRRKPGRKPAASAA